MPFTPLDSTDPRDLWKWMDEQRAAGNELLAISHNANLSDGFMFPTEVDHTGRPIDQAWAEARMRNEPLTEMKQVKGQSETTPGLSPNDEFANYEVFVWHTPGPAGPAAAASTAATSGRPTRTASRWSRRAASIPTSSAW